ncbi:MAG: hypothetical protein ABIJ18_04760 [archaeon]
MKRLLIILLLLFIMGCAQKEMFTPEFCITENSTDFTDDEIINLTYSDCKIPENFYYDISPEEDVDYRSVTNLSDWEFYCGDKFNEERTKVKGLIYQNNLADGRVRKLVNSEEKENFFEFKVTESEEAVILYRVFKCNYLGDLKYGSYSGAENIIGVYTGERTEEKIKELVEFLWYSGLFQNYKNDNVKAISSITGENSQTIYEIKLKQEENQCDKVYLIKSEYTIDEEGNINLKQGVEKTLTHNCPEVEIPTEGLVYST